MKILKKLAFFAYEIIIAKVMETIVIKKPKVDSIPPTKIEVIKPVVKLKLYETIPLPTTKTITGAVLTLNKVQELTDVRADYMALIVALESSFDYTVKAKTSSATGWFQMIDRTWNTLMSRYAAKFEIPTNVENDLRMDPRINALMGAELIKENITVIKPSIGRDLTLLEIYLAHFFGAGHAKRFILASPDANSVELFKAQAKANTSIFYNKGKPRTIREVTAVLEKRIASNLKLVNDVFN